MLRMLLTEHESVPWHALLYLTAEITYGGRVTDIWDKRCLMNIVEKFCSPDSLEDGFSYTGRQVNLSCLELSQDVKAFSMNHKLFASFLSVLPPSIHPHVFLGLL